MAGRCTCCIALDHYTRLVEHVLRQVVKDFVEALGMPRGSDERLMQLCFQARLYLGFLAFSPSLFGMLGIVLCKFGRQMQKAQLRLLR